MKEIEIKFCVNGENVTINAHPFMRLLDVLREKLKLTGTKEGCGEGECGACSVLVDGLLVNSCLIPAIQIQDCVVESIEGVAKQDTLDSIQKAFIKHGGAQCGMCTPGMIMATINIRKSHKNPTADQIREALAGNFCRCTGYTKIIDAVQAIYNEKDEE